MIRTDLGPVSAYALAVEIAGYTGSEEDFAQLQANSANNAQIANIAANNAIRKAGDAAASAAAAASSAASAEAAAASAAQDVREDIVDETLSSLGYAADAAITGANFEMVRSNLAGAYDSTKTYAIGDYVYYGTDGDLYRCTTAITTPEAWTVAHWDVVNVGGELSELKENLNELVVNVHVALDFEQGTIDVSNGGTSPSNTRIRSQYIPNENMSITVDNTIKYSLRGYTENDVYVEYTTWLTGTSVIKFNSDSVTKFRIVVAHIDDSNISPSSDFDIALTKTAYTDKTLSVSDKAADAEVVGDMFETMKQESEVVIKSSLVSSNASLTFVQGAIRPSDGAPSATNTTRIRSTFTEIGAGLSIALPNGLSGKAFYYNNNNDSDRQYIGDIGVFTEGSVEVLPFAKYARIVLRYTDDSNIAPSDASDVTATGYDYTDKTLTEKNKAADAEVVGDNIELSRLIEEALIDSIGSTTIELTQWIQGTISAANGANNVSNTRIRARGYEQYEEAKIVKVTIPEGFKCSIREYSGNPVASSEAVSVYVGYIPRGESASFAEGTFYFQPNNNYFYRYVVAKIDDTDITPSDFTRLSIQSIGGNNHIVTTKLATGTLLGNVTIRAAKRFMFNDGTPPVIDWYLLQDTDNNFYSSKDLSTKTFLFRFDAPSSIVANWSCGIDADNNIFFIKDAAGYTDDDGPRLNDAKRVNPIYFLASENYKNVHELDFGNSFKPAGWFEDLGWCVLPNKDIIMCEYTRGTLATCNVWHIDSSDTTDPANWEVTWSHEIIDTVDTNTPGVKHCHAVQYDFYTGICYFGTGDSDSGSYVYHSTDNGLTWELTYGPEKKRGRWVSIAFTKDKAYYASDSYEAQYKGFFIVDRDENGILDITNATEVSLPAINRQACYGCVFIENLNLILMMDRSDQTAPVSLTLKGYDISAGVIKTVAILEPANNTQRIGFRTKFIDWYPTGNDIHVGFNPKAASINPDVNVIAACGNQGGLTGDGSNRINNLCIHVYKKENGDFSLRMTTISV